MNKRYSPAPTPTEADEQRALFAWAAWNQGKYPELKLMYHIPNEGKRSARTGANLKAQGLKKGVPDIHLPVARGEYHGLFIELKANDGRPTPEQVEWINGLKDQGYVAAICNGMDVAKDLIMEYLGMEDRL